MLYYTDLDDTDMTENNWHYGIALYLHIYAFKISNVI